MIIYIYIYIKSATEFSQPIVSGRNLLNQNTESTKNQDSISNNAIGRQTKPCPHLLIGFLTYTIKYQERSNMCLAGKQNKTYEMRANRFNKIR